MDSVSVAALRVLANSFYCGLVLGHLCCCVILALYCCLESHRLNANLRGSYRQDLLTGSADGVRGS